jgi:antitoxin PrlF
MMPTATMASKGQITIPKEIREQLNLKAGHRLEFTIDTGKLTVTPRNRDIRSLKGSIRLRRRRPVSVTQMNEAIAEGFAKP